MKAKTPADLVSLLASVQEPKGRKGVSGLVCNYIGDWWVSAAAHSSLDFSSIKHLVSLRSALPPTSLSLHYQLKVIFDGVKVIACYNSGAAFFIISQDLCNYTGFKVSLYKGGFEMAGGITNNFAGKLDKAKLILHP